MSKTGGRGQIAAHNAYCRYSLLSIPAIPFDTTYFAFLAADVGSSYGMNNCDLGL